MTTDRKIKLTAAAIFWTVSLLVWLFYLSAYPSSNPRRYAFAVELSVATLILWYTVRREPTGPRPPRRP